MSGRYDIWISRFILVGVFAFLLGLLAYTTHPPQYTATTTVAQRTPAAH